jgi:NADH dehydrogenase (ubiquinone) 1 beta subcomplex subunit 7
MHHYIEPTASHEEMKAARLPISFRDYCAHLLIPLNKCRQQTYYLPWKCGDERHIYEKCEYVEHLKAVKRKLEESPEASR